MAGHELDALRHHLVGNRHGLLRIAGVVADFENELFAIDAAGGVDVGHRHFGAALQLLAESGILAGDRAGDGDRRRPPGPWRPKARRRSRGQRPTTDTSSYGNSLGIYDRKVFRGLRHPLQANLGPKAYAIGKGRNRPLPNSSGPIWPARTGGRTARRPRDTG